LANSHTGRRLKEMIPDGMEYKVINSSSQNIFQSGDIVNIAAHNFIEAKKLIKEE